MRKVLSFVLVLSLVLGSFGMAFAAAPLSDMAGQKSEEAVKVLTELGVVSGYPDGTYKPANIVTRAEMAVIVVSALGLADYATGTSSFSDMGGHWSNGFVAYATSLGIISGYPDGTFKPDKTVSYDEAATMLVAALGYNADSLVGTWPANFVTKAKTLGILDGIKSGAAGANRGDIAIMTYQALDQAIGKTNKDGDFVYDKDADNNAVDTMLARLGAKLYEDPDQFVDAKTGYAFIVDGDEDSIINLKPFLGAYVTAYANEDGEIIAIKEVKSVYITGSFDVAVDVDTADIADGADFDADKDYTFKGAVDPDDIEFFVNGENGAKYDLAADPTEYTLAVKVSGKRITDLYSVAAWNINDDFLYEDDMLEDDNLNGNDFALNDDDEIDMASFALLGVANLEDIDEDDVVYVYNNDDGIARIAVGTEVVTGEVTKINAGSDKITVDGKVYEMWNGDDFSVSLDDEVELRLDYNGKVYDVDTVKGQPDSYAVLLDWDDEDGSLRGSDALVELFLADGTSKIFDVDGDIDNTLIKEGYWQDGEGSEAEVAKAGIVVEYSLDKNGVIDGLNTVSMSSLIEGKELTSKGYYNGMAVKSDAVLFTYDFEGTDTAAQRGDDDNYGVTTVAKASGKDLDAKYLIDSGKIVVMLIEGYGDSDDDVFGVVTGRARTSASDTDYQLTLLVDGAEVSYDVTKGVYDGFGGSSATYNYLTVYKLKFNASDAISGLTEATSGSDPDEDYETILGDFRTVMAYSNGVATVDTDNDGVEDDDDDTDFTLDTSGVAYVLNDDEDGYELSRISRSNLVGNDVKLYDTNEDGVADLVLIYEN